MPTHTYLFDFDDSRKREIFQCCVFLGGHLFKEMHSHGIGTRPNNLSVSIKHKFNIHNNNFTANYSVALSALHRLHCALITGTHRTITGRPWKHDERPEQNLSYQKQTSVFYDVKNSVSLDGTPFCSKGMGNDPVYTPSVSAWFIW